MDKLLFGVSVLTSLLEAIAQTTREVFIFPKESNSAHVSLITQLEKPLKNFTACLHAYTDLSREEIWFVYQGIYIKPNILDWWALNYTMQGYMATRPHK
uniref:Pentraxin (PTX) domain-containing protein n=1 Tax=Piliocolobus tephrosceles TaxID=591936 RepID=A0A8C9HBQ7_9PRIM